MGSNPCDGQRSGNNWYRRDGTTNIHIEIQGDEIPKLGKSGTYQYLGHDISLDGKSSSLKLLIYLLLFLKFWTKSIRLCFLL